MRIFLAPILNFVQYWDFIKSWNQKSKSCVWAYVRVVSIRCWDFDILLMSSLTIFGSVVEKTLQGHTIFLTILHQGVKRTIFIRVKHHKKSDYSGKMMSIFQWKSSFSLWYYIRALHSGISKPRYHQCVSFWRQNYPPPRTRDILGLIQSPFQGPQKENCPEQSGR